MPKAGSYWKLSLRTTEMTYKIMLIIKKEYVHGSFISYSWITIGWYFCIIKTALNIFHREKCVFHITLDWLGKSSVNHQDTLWLSTGRVERLVLPVASVGGIKLLPTGSKYDIWFVQSPSKLLFFIKATLNTTFMAALFSFFC